MESVAISAAQINWNGGQRITLTAGDTATCTALSPGQLYGIFIYNSAQNDNNSTVSVNWSNSQPPVPITVLAPRPMQAWHRWVLSRAPILKPFRSHCPATPVNHRSKSGWEVSACRPTHRGSATIRCRPMVSSIRSTSTPATMRSPHRNG